MAEAIKKRGKEEKLVVFFSSSNGRDDFLQELTKLNLRVTASEYPIKEASEFSSFIIILPLTQNSVLGLRSDISDILSYARTVADEAAEIFICIPYLLRRTSAVEDGINELGAIAAGRGNVIFYEDPTDLAEQVYQHSSITQKAQDSPDSKEPQTRDSNINLPSHVLSDSPIADAEADLLEFNDYATSIAALIDNPETSTPLTIAIHAPWGAGKSSLATLIKNQLISKPAAGGTSPHVICEFNAWMHDDAEHLASSFVVEIAQTADKFRSPWYRIFNPLPNFLLPHARRRRRRFLYILFGVVALLMLASFVIYELKGVDLSSMPADLFKENEIVSGLLKYGGKFGIWASLTYIVYILITTLSSAASSIADFVKDPKSEATLGSMADVRSQLRDLISQATIRGNRFIIILDDLERCQPPKCMDVLEALNQLVGHERVVTLIPTDANVLAACAEIKYEKLAKKSPSIQFGKFYLQKFIQLQFDLPKLRPDRIKQFASAVTERRILEGNGDKKNSNVNKNRVKSRLIWTTVESPTQTWYSNHLKTRGWIKFLAMLVAAPCAVIAWFYIRVVRANYPLNDLRANSSAENDGNYNKQILMFSLGLATIGVAITYFKFQSELSTLNPMILIPAGILIYFLGILPFTISIVAGVRRDEEEKSISKLREKLTEAPTATGAKDKEKIQVSDNLREQIVTEREQLYLTTESDAFKKAREVLSEYLPEQPRNAKRALNRLRLFLLIAHARGLLTSTRLEPEVIAKWLALQELWPELANRIFSNQDFIKRLEAASPEHTNDSMVPTPDPWPKLLGEFRLSSNDETRLRKFINSPPKLSPAVEILVTFGAEAKK